MPKAKVKTTMVDLVQIIDEEELTELVGEATASLLFNPTVMWAKFILTDNMPNGNGMRVPTSEFENLIESGIHMPVKMVQGSIEEHDGATPLGVITHLVQQNDKVIALAALWERERPADVGLIRSRFNAGEPVDISWELLYGDYAIAPDGTMDLLDVALRAATIVDTPAYQGRTPVLAVAAKKWSKAFISKLPDSSFMFVQKKPGENGETIRLFPIKDGNGKLDKDRVRASIVEMADANLPITVTKQLRETAKRLLEMLESNASMAEITAELGAITVEPADDSTSMEENKLDELKKLQDSLDASQADLKEVTDELAAKEKELAEKKAELETLNIELTELREFKAGIELEAEKIQKLEDIKTKFAEAGIEKEDEYFNDNADDLLAMTEEAMSFLLQELVAFGKKAGNTDSASLKTKIPNISDMPEDVDLQTLAQALRERNTK